MKIGLFGKKIGMTRIFLENGTAVPVTVIEVQPSVITQIKTKDKDGYSALQLGYGERREKHTVKSQKALFQKVGTAFKDVLYEIRLNNDIDNINLGEELGIDNFEAGDIVDVSGISIGKGFQGVMKRHHFSGGRGSHGDKTGRRSGSIGQSSYPSRVFKGMKGPGRMGGEQVTVQNLKVIKVDVDNNILAVEGAVPGPKNNILRVSISLKEGTDKELKIKGKKKSEKKTDVPEVVTADKGKEAPSQEPDNVPVGDKE